MLRGEVFAMHPGLKNNSKVRMAELKNAIFHGQASNLCSRLRLDVERS
jgi:hypothetical protein